MFQSKRLAMILTFALLLTSTVVLSGCRSGCADNDLTCKTGISPTYTVPPVPTATTPPLPTDPKQAVQQFLNIYSGDEAGLVQLAPLFSSAYAKVSPDVIACSASNARSTFGKPSIAPEIKDPTITGDTATVVATVTSPGRKVDSTFTLSKQGNYWTIDSITSWIGGDITPDNPVGDTSSCLPSGGAGSGDTGATTPTP